MLARPRFSLSLLLALASLVPCPAAALDLGWGFRAGWSAARLHGSFGDQVGADYLGNFTAAVYARAPLRGWLGFQPEVSFATKGGEGDVEVGSAYSPGVTYAYHLEHRVSYLEVPLLLRIDAPSRGGLRPYLLLGPAPALRVGDPRTTAALDSSQGAVPAPARLRAPRPTAVIFEDVGTLDGDIRTRSFDLGVVGGLGAWYGRGPTRVGLEARYVWGLLDTHPSDAAQVRNGMFALTAAIEVR